MNGFTLTTDLIIMLLPPLAIQIGLAIYCMVKIFREGVQNLNRWAWLAICLFANLIGPIVFLIVGRKRDR